MSDVCLEHTRPCGLRMLKTRGRDRRFSPEMLLLTQYFLENFFMKVIGDSEHFKQPFDHDEDYVSRAEVKREIAIYQ
ncbi:MAG: hypothetical protein ACI90A_000034, partial [Shewanella sp.]